MGSLIFMANYIGLNQYKLSYLININNLQLIIFSGLMVLFPLTLMSIEESDRAREVYSIDWIRRKVKIVHWLIRIILFAFVLYFMFLENPRYSGYFVLATTPGYIMLYFLMRKLVINKPVKFGNELMRINLVNSLVMSLFFGYFFLNKTQLLQAVLAGY